MIEDNLGLAGMVAKRYLNLNFEYDDLFQVACIGLIKAVDLFDPSRGFKFSTLAVKVINYEILKHMRKQKKHEQILSLDEPMKGTADFRLLDVLEDDCNIATEVVEKIQYVGYLDNLKKVSFTPKERECIRLRSQGLTQTEIAELLGTNQVQVSRYLKRAKGKVATVVGLDENFNTKSHRQQPVAM